MKRYHSSTQKVQSPSFSHSSLIPRNSFPDWTPAKYHSTASKWLDSNTLWCHSDSVMMIVLYGDRSFPIDQCGSMTLPESPITFRISSKTYRRSSAGSFALSIFLLFSSIESRNMSHICLMFRIYMMPFQTRRSHWGWSDCRTLLPSRSWAPHLNPSTQYFTELNQFIHICGCDR